MHLPYKAAKSSGPRQIVVEGPSSPPRQLTARRPPVSSPTSPSAASAKKQAAPTAPVQPPVAHAEPQQDEWVDVQEHPEEQVKDEQVKPALPAKEHMAGQLPAFEPVLQFVGEPSEKKDINANESNSSPITAEEKAAAWVADLEEEEDDDGEDGSIEDCQV